MTQRHRYIVPLVDRHTGQESERTIEAVSAADAQAQMAGDPTVYVGTARRADGTPEPFQSPYDRLAHMGLDQDRSPGLDPDSQPDRTGFESDPDSDLRAYLHESMVPPPSDPYIPRLDAELGDILAVCKLQSDRIAWIQRFLVWTVYGIPLAIIGFVAALSFLGSLARPDFDSPLAMTSAFIAVLCFGSLVALLQSIYPTFMPRKKMFRPIRMNEDDIHRLRQRLTKSQDRQGPP